MHHIVPLEEDFERRLDDTNLLTLCERHHKAADRGEIDRDTLFALAKASPRGRCAGKLKISQDHMAPLENKKFPKWGKTGNEVKQDGETKQLC